MCKVFDDEIAERNACKICILVRLGYCTKTVNQFLSYKFLRPRVMVKYKCSQ